MGPQAKVGSSFPFLAIQGACCLFMFSQLAWQRGGVWNKPLPPAPTCAHRHAGCGVRGKQRALSLSEESLLGTFPFSVISDPVSHANVSNAVGKLQHGLICLPAKAGFPEN